MCNQRGVGKSFCDKVIKEVKEHNARFVIPMRDGTFRLQTDREVRDKVSQSFRTHRKKQNAPRAQSPGQVGYETELNASSKVGLPSGGMTQVHSDGDKTCARTEFLEENPATEGVKLTGGANAGWSAWSASSNQLPIFLWMILIIVIIIQIILIDDKEKVNKIVIIIEIWCPYFWMIVGAPYIKTHNIDPTKNKGFLWDLARVLEEHGYQFKIVHIYQGGQSEQRNNHATGIHRDGHVGCEKLIISISFLAFSNSQFRLLKIPLSNGRAIAVEGSRSGSACSSLVVVLS